MAVSYCGACGAEARDGESFCVACGQSLRRPDTAVVAQSGPADAAKRQDQIVFQHALNLLARQDPATASGILERLVDERPDWAVARAYLGVALLRMTRVADARAELEQAVRQAPKSFICHMKYGEFLARLGFYDQAMRELDVALALPAPDAESSRAAMELRQFAKDKGKGLFYRETGYPSLSRLLPRRRTSHHAVQTERGV